jgi:beta-glucanase (GH16 family)
MPRRTSIRLLCLAIAAAAALFATVAAGAQAGSKHHRSAESRTARAKHHHRHRIGLRTARRVARVSRFASSRSLTVTPTQSPSPGATISGAVNWEVNVSGGTVNRVEFLIDGNLKWTEYQVPYQAGGQTRGFDTTKVSDGAHTLTAVAYGSRDRTGRSSIQVTVDNAGTQPQTQPQAQTPSPDTNLVFSDEFDGPAGSRPDSSKWVAINWCDRWGSLSCNTNRTDNVSLDGQGDLRVRAIKQNWTDVSGNTGTWTSARLETQSHFKFTYGTIKARIKVPAGKGFWPSFWTNAQTGWPATGEIDVMELLGDKPATYYCSVHGSSDGTNHVSTTLGHTEPTSLANGFHVYEARWSPAKVDFFVDGNSCGSVPTTSLVSFAPQQILVGMAVGGSWPGSPDASTPTTGDMLVDWVRAYQ